MNSRFIRTLPLIIIVGCVVVGIIAYPHLPVAMVSHWNAAGQANGTLSKFWGIFILPIVMLLIFGIWELLPRIDPIAPGFKAFRKIYDLFIVLITALLAYVYALILGVNLGLQIQIIPMVMAAFALLVFVLGALLPHLKRNWFIGIRTPWTISNEIVWEKTHELGSRLIEIAALFILAGAFMPRDIAILFILVPLLSAALISVVYSYFVFQAQKK